MLQAPEFDCLSFDPFSLFDDGRGSAEVGVGRRDVAKALVVASVIVMLDEGFDLAFEIAREEVVLQQDAVLERQIGDRFLQCAGLTAKILHLSGRGSPGRVTRQPTLPASRNSFNQT